MESLQTDRLNLLFPKQTERRFTGAIEGAIAGLELPMLSAEDVDHDLALSPHLKALQSIRLEEEGGCCVIQSETEELGLLAAAYVAARHGAVYRNDLLTLEDFLPTDPMTQEDLNEESSLELGGFLPIHRLRPNTVFFEENAPDNTYVLSKQWRRMSLPHWSAVPSEHPLILCVESPAEELVLPEVLRQTAVRSLTLVVMPITSWKGAFGTFMDIGSSFQALAEELRFSHATETVKLYQLSSPTSRYNQLVLLQALEEAGLALDKRCSVRTVLKSLGAFRAKRGGVTNGNIEKYVRLLRHLYLIGSSRRPLVMTRQQALEPLTLSALRADNRLPWTQSAELFGCEEVKRQLQSVVDTMLVDRERRASRLPASGHGQVLLFAGPPGTGKSTAAQMLYQWLFQNHLLDAEAGGVLGGFVQVSGAQLKAPYVGQTAPLVHDLFAGHSFLFIDGAYALAEAGEAGAGNDHYAQEALGQLCVELENLPPDHVVVFAGYGGERDNRMRAFLRANPGLSSRITQTIRFAPYTADKELPDIFSHSVRKRGLSLPDLWRSEVVPYFQRRARQEDYGSGREARRLLESWLRMQAHRLAGASDFQPLSLSRLSMADLRAAIADLEAGFRTLNAGKALPCGLARDESRAG